MCILFVYTLLILCLSYYDLSVLAMSVMGFQIKTFGWGGWLGAGEISIHFFFEFCKAPKPLRLIQSVNQAPESCTENQFFLVVIYFLRVSVSLVHSSRKDSTRVRLESLIWTTCDTTRTQDSDSDFTRAIENIWLEQFTFTGCLICVQNILLLCQ